MGRSIVAIVLSMNTQLQNWRLLLVASSQQNRAWLLMLLPALFFASSRSFGQTSAAGDDLLLLLPPILASQSNATTTTTNTSTNTDSLCTGFAINDQQNRPMQPMAKPAPGASYVDSVFGSNITRISDSSAISSGIIKTMYSTVQAWNADESKMVLWHRGVGHHLYNGESYELIERLPVSPADIEQLFWSTSDPDLMYYSNSAVGSSVDTANGPYRLRGNELMSYNVRSREFELIRDLNNVCSGGDRITAGGDAHMISFDDDVFGLRCGDTGFSYRRSTDTVTLQASSAGGFAPQAFPSGDRFYHQGGVLNSQLSTERRLDLGNVSEHSSLGRLHNGNDGYFAVAFGANQNNRCGDGIGSVVVHDATDASCRVLVGPANGWPFTLSGTHISALAHQRPGWAAVSSIGFGVEGDTVLEQELYLVNTDPAKPNVCRIAHHRATGGRGSIGYFAEPHPVLSPSGTRVLFSSDWNNSGTVDVYVVELNGIDRG